MCFQRKNNNNKFPTRSYQHFHHSVCDGGRRRCQGTIGKPDHPLLLNISSASMCWIRNTKEKRQEHTHSLSLSIYRYIFSLLLINLSLLEMFASTDSCSNKFQFVTKGVPPTGKKGYVKSVCGCMILAV